MKTTVQKLETKRIILYLAITFTLTCAWCFGVVYPINSGGSLREMAAVVTQLAVAAVMFVPAIGVLLTRLITKEGFRDAQIRPRLKGNVKYYLLAWFGPGVLTLLGAAVYFVFFPDQFDPDCGYLKSVLAAAGTSPEAYPMPLSMLLGIQAVQAFLMGPILNFFTCFGEEWGWRGYLLPKMSKKLPTVPMLFVTGVIWGLWHAPLTAIGHNYGLGYPGFPFTGIAAMCIFCIVIGIFLSFVSLKTKSCIPAVIGHGAINSISAIGVYFTKDGGNPFLGPAPTGIVGALPFIIAAALMVIFGLREKEAL